MTSNRVLRSKGNPTNSNPTNSKWSSIVITSTNYWIDSNSIFLFWDLWTCEAAKFTLQIKQCQNCWNQTLTVKNCVIKYCRFKSSYSLRLKLNKNKQNKKKLTNVITKFFHVSSKSSTNLFFNTFFKHRWKYRASERKVNWKYMFIDTMNSLSQPLLNVWKLSDIWLDKNQQTIHTIKG